MRWIGPHVRAVGSLWFAAVLLMLCLVAMALATVFESIHGTERALHEFYRARWFELLLWLLGLNVLAAMVVRFPFSRHQMGFVLTHGAILVTLIGALVTKHWGINEGRVGILEGQTVSTFSVPQQVLRLTSGVDGRRATIELPARVFGGFEIVQDPQAPTLEIGPVTARVEWYVPDGEWSRRVVNDHPTQRTAVEVSLSSDGRSETAWVFAGQPAKVSDRTVYVISVDARAALNEAFEAEVQRADIEVFSGPGDTLHVRFADGGEGRNARQIEVGTPIAWGSSGQEFAVTQRFDHARVAPAFTPVEPVRQTRNPGVFVKVTAGEEVQTLWLSKFRPTTVTLAGVSYELAYANKVVPLGFDLRLDRFHIGHYPGTGRPRSFESTITINDVRRGGTYTRVVSMNHPVKYGGWTLYQSSYQERPQVASILSVARDPGQPVIFAGYIVLTVGVLWVLVHRISVHRKAQRAGVTEVNGSGHAERLEPRVTSGDGSQRGSGTGVGDRDVGEPVLAGHSVKRVGRVKEY